MLSDDNDYTPEETKQAFTELIKSFKDRINNINVKYMSNDEIETQIQYYIEQEIIEFAYEYDVNGLLDIDKYLDSFQSISQEHSQWISEETYNRCQTNNAFKLSLYQWTNLIITEQDLEIEKTNIENFQKFIRKNNLDEPGKNKVRYNGIRKSYKKGWKRGLAKYKPNLAYHLSPIKPTVANYASVLLRKEISDSLLWLLVMSETSFYNNSCLLCIEYMQSPCILKKLLRNNSKSIDYYYLRNNWTDIAKLGSGTFGLVVKFMDKLDKKKYAVKYIKSNLCHTRFDTLEFLVERNYLIQASKSPLVVRVMYSFQMPDLSGLFLVMEYCISDLNKFLSYVNAKTKLKPVKTLNQSSNLLLEAYDFLMKTYILDMRKIGMVYIFELFAILDHLASCNIVHNDLKPANIMISDRFHLKVGDLGFANNTYYILESNRVNLFKSENIIEQQSEKHEYRKGGTPLYRDPETAYLYLSGDKKLKKKVTYQLDFSKIDAETNDKNFLYDTWAMGVIAAEILLLGANIFDYPEFSDEEKQLFDDESVNLYYHILSLASEKYHKLIEPGFDQVFDGFLGDLPKFVASTLNVRSQRCTEFMKAKKVLIYSRQEIFRSIDISKVEEIDVFKSNDFNSSNVFLYSMPGTIDMFLPNEEMRKKFPDFDAYLEEIKSLNDADLGMLNMQPGINLKYNVV